MKSSGFLISAFILCILSGCGGGGGSSNNTAASSSTSSSQANNNLPTVAISGAVEVQSGQTLSLTANATDSDGSIASYAWVVDSGSLSLSDPTKSQISFIAPVVDKDTTTSLSVTVADDKGATAKASKQITIRSIKESLTITGKVINGGVISNADLTFTLGDLSFKTKADSSGIYSYTLDVDPVHLDIPLVITATGDATNPTVKLVSQLNSIKILINQAGGDKKLEAKENIHVNVSNVTTAEYYLLTKPSSSGIAQPSILKESQLQSALENVGVGSKIQLASFLYIIATDSRFKLPTAASNTFDFLQDQQAVNAFRSLAYLQDSTLIDKTVALINKNTDLVAGASDLIGTYIIYGDEYKSYLLTLNSDFSGELAAVPFGAAFTWVKQGSKIVLNFPTPLETGRTDYRGRWVIKSAELNIYDEYPAKKLANFFLPEVLINNNGLEIATNYPEIPVIVYDTSKIVTPEASTIVGNWVVGDMYNAANVQFNANNSLLITSLASPNETNNLSWSIDGKKLSIKTQDNRTEDIYFVRDLDVGYATVKVHRSQTGVSYFSNGLFIKKQSNLVLKKSDFVGQWNDGSGLIKIMANDGALLNDFGAWPEFWVSNESDSSWSVNKYSLGNADYLTSCDAAAGTNAGCSLYSTFKNKVIANSSNRYYSIGENIIYSASGSPTVNYSLRESIKLPGIQYFEQWMLNRTQKTFYQSTTTGIKVWNFYENRLIISNKSLANGGLFNDLITVSLNRNHLQYSRDNVARELALINSSENGLTVCEYNQGASCAVGTEFLLSNRSPAKVSLKVVGPGSIFANSLSSAALLSEALFGNAAVYDVRPDSGAVIKSVTGCGGQLNSGRYVTAEVRESCTITATFGNP